MLIDTENQQIADITDTPPLEELRAELSTCLMDSSTYLDQYRFDFETRFCLWDAQSRDGRRWQARTGTQHKVKPWDGASDVRTFTADDIINEQVDVMMSAFHRANLQVTAVQSTDTEWSTKVSMLLTWLLRNHLAGELGAELEKAANWRQGYGLALAGIWWDQTWRLQRVVRTLEEMIASATERAQEGDPSGLRALAQLADPSQDEATVARMLELAPILDRQAARRIIRQMREEGQAEIPTLSVLRNQPCVEALRPFLDVFFPVETRDIQKARWVQRRRVLTLAELENNISTLEWDRDWARELAETGRGKSFGALMDYRSLPLRNGGDRFLFSTLRGPSTGALPGENYVEVWDAYYPGIDRKTGAPVMMHTVWSPLVQEKFARHAPFGYDHQKMPFVAMVRERVEDALADSRSVPEIAATFQGTIKTHRDAANDYAQMTTIPPLLVPLWRSGTDVKLGPTAQIPMKPSDDLKFLAPPQWTGVSEKCTEAATLALARYFGCIHELVPAPLTALRQERLVTGFLGEVALISRQMLQLCQQYMSDVEAERVVGPLKMPFKMSREEIQGQFNLLLTFDATNLNPELTKAKLEAFHKYVVSIDTEGTVNRTALAQLGARMLDPWLADAVVGDPAVAAQQEVEDEKKNLAMMLNGVEPPMRPEGQNYQLRLNALLSEIQANPYLPPRIQSQPDTQAMLQARIQHLTTMAEQYGINRQIGRTGAEPGLQKLREEMAQPAGGNLQAA